jgi:SAM-dependent methyltransferase
MVFDQYAQFYDLYYQGKNYSKEVDFVLELVSKFGLWPKSALDMGCGTGRHLFELAKRGIDGYGFDRSREMLKLARARLTRLGVKVTEGDLRSFRNGKKYDLVLAMFAVMGYLTSNSDLLAGFITAREHLAPGGLFVFDGWFGPAVLAQGPEERIHEYKKDGQTILRKATPYLDPVNQVTTVRYEIISKNAKDGQKSLKEEHIMRFMFVQETKLAMNASGLELLHCCPFLCPDGDLSLETWNITFVGHLADTRISGWRGQTLWK